jgi:hypothetical protein
MRRAVVCALSSQLIDTVIRVRVDIAIPPPLFFTRVIDRDARVRARAEFGR